MAADSASSAKPRSFRLRREESVGAGLRRIAAGRADSALEKLRGADQETLAAAVHGTRKDLKKLRAVLRLCRDGLGEELFRAENERYRDAARLLSRSRDAEVKLATLSALRRRFGADLPRAAVAVWEEALERERDRMAGRGQQPDVPLAEAIAAIEEGRRRIDGWPLDNASWKLVGAGLRRSYRGARRGWKRAIDDRSPESTHEWRKRGKDLWYQLRIVAPAWAAVLEPTAGQAHELTERLGDHHDLALLAEDLDARGWVGEDDRAELGAAIERRQEELVDGALEIGARLFAEPPNAFRRRIGDYWSQWRG